MANLTIEISEDNLNRLKLRAEKAGIPPEEYLASSLEEWLSGSGNDFRTAIGYVLQKNAELYKRLAE